MRRTTLFTYALEKKIFPKHPQISEQCRKMPQKGAKCRKKFPAFCGNLRQIRRKFPQISAKTSFFCGFLHNLCVQSTIRR